MALGARFRHWISGERGTLRKGRFAIALAGIYVLFAATYLPINLFSVGRPASVLYLPGESRIPFLPIFEYLYVLTFFVPALLLATVRSWGRFAHLLRALAMALVVAYSTYLVFPVYLERPPLVATSSPHAWLLSIHYLDKSYNHFPSLHVTLSWLAVRSAEVSPRSRAGLAAVAWGIGISTVFVKQHYIADVAFGYLLAWGAWNLAEARQPSAAADNAG